MDGLVDFGPRGRGGSGDAEIIPEQEEGTEAVPGEVIDLLLGFEGGLLHKVYKYLERAKRGGSSQGGGGGCSEMIRKRGKLKDMPKILQLRFWRAARGEARGRFISVQYNFIF